MAAAHLETLLLAKKEKFSQISQKAHLSPAALTECSWSGDGLCCGAFSLVNTIETTKIIKNLNLFKRASHGLIQAASHRKSRARCRGAHIGFPEGLDCSAENKTQLWGARSCSLEVEMSERSSASRRSARRLAVRTPGPLALPSPPAPLVGLSPDTSRSLGTEAAAPQPSSRRAPRHPGRKPPAPWPHAAGAELSAEQMLRVTSRILPVIYSSTITLLPPERDVPRHLPKGEIPPARSPSREASKAPAVSKAGGRETRGQGLWFSSSLRVNCMSQALNGTSINV